MLNYKRLTFVFLFTTIFLLATDTQMERQARKSLLSLFDIVVTESGQVGETAPSSFLDTAEEMRISTYNFLNKEGQNLSDKIADSKGFISIALNIAFYIVMFFKFIATFVITFYPFVLFVLYLFFTSSFFKKDEFYGENF